MQQSLHKEILKDHIFVDPPKDGKAIIIKVHSKSVEGKLYDLRVMPDGEVKCSCPWNVLSGKKCSHISDYLSVHNNIKETDTPEDISKAMKTMNVYKVKEPKKVGSFAQDFPF